MDREAIRLALASARFRFRNEADLQDGIAQVLDGLQVPYQREYRLSSRDVIDFFLDGFGIEVKVKGSATAVLTQLARYAEFPAITSLLLVTSRTQLAAMPTSVCGKPLKTLALIGSLL